LEQSEITFSADLNFGAVDRILRIRLEELSSAARVNWQVMSMRHSIPLIRLVMVTCGTVVVCYALAVLWIVSTTPDPGIRVLLSETPSAATPESVYGIVVRRIVGPAIPIDKTGPQPVTGDRLLQLGDTEVNSFLDFTTVLARLRSFDVPPGGLIQESNRELLQERLVADVRRLPPLVEQAGTGERYIRLRLGRGGREYEVWMPLQPLPLAELLLTLAWFLLQFGILSVGGLALWARPFDRAERVFFAMCLVTMAGFVGGFHWWTIAGSLWLTVPFAIAAVLIPVVSLHFFCLYPDPKPWFILRPRQALLALYGLPVLSIAGLLSAILISNLSHHRQQSPNEIQEQLQRVMQSIHASLVVAAGYFVMTLIALADSFFSQRNILKQRQVEWILGAALAATLPVGYTLYLARFDKEAFALGSATIPMFAASLLFMVAYAVGVLGPKLNLLEEVVDRGMTYYLLSGGLSTLASLGKLSSGLLGLWQYQHFPNQAPMVLALVLAALGLMSFARDRLQQFIDRIFNRNRFPLDRAMQPLFTGTSGLGNPETMAQRLLSACRELLGVDRAALYLREGDDGAFPLIAKANLDRAPLRFASDQELLELLESGSETANARGQTGSLPESSRSLRMLRELDIELVHALDAEDRLDGALMLGPKRNGTHFTSDDLLLLGSLGHVMRVALQGARVQQVVARLSEDLQHKNSRLNEQQRLIAMLQSEITARNTHASVGVPGTDSVPFRRETIKGNSAAVREVLETVRKVSQSDSSVLVRGESGTGKELLALALHDNSPRRNGPLVSVHCGALSPGLLESELFGHVKGAFTGAHRDKVGRFEMASGGTLFLDEIGDISPETQIKLLRVLQQREFEPVGGTQSIQVDVRLIAATHQNLEKLIAEGKFREDLYYRLNVISITLPPLRERGDDIIELALHFLTRAAERAGKRVSHLDDGAIDALRRYSWPGNIRELENAIERAVVLADGSALTVAELPAAVLAGLPQSNWIEMDSHVRGRAPTAPTVPGRRRGRPPRGASKNNSPPEPGRADLVEALAKAGGNKAEAARLLGVPRSTFFSRMKRFGLE
jgi:transcriptional regulator with GAF, ATPase, and Fis domain